MNRELQGSTGFLIWTIYPQNLVKRNAGENKAPAVVSTACSTHGYAILRSAILSSLQPGFIVHWESPTTCRNLRADDIIGPTDPSRQSVGRIHPERRQDNEPLGMQQTRSPSRFPWQVAISNVIVALPSDGKSPLKLPQLKDLSHEEQTQPDLQDGNLPVDLPPTFGRSP